MIRVLLLLLAIACALPAHASDTGAHAFVDVNVVPMDRETVLLRQTVVIRDGVIAAIGPAADVSVPADAMIIQGHGLAWLAPGLADMHTHVFETNDLALFLAHGVTTILDMGGGGLPPSLVRPMIARGELDGPNMYFSFIVDGQPPYTAVVNARDAAAVAHLAKAAEYSFLKVYNSLSEEAFSAIVEEAHQHGLGVIGHGVRAVGLPEALERGQIMVAHAEEFFYTAFENQRNAERLLPVAEQVAATGAYVTPNLAGFEVIARQWGDPDTVTSFLRAPEAAYLSPRTLLLWTEPRYSNRTAPTRDTMFEILSFLRAFTRALDESGVPLLTGTDTTPIPGVFPGSSLHEELRNLRESGVDHFATLSAATRVPGEFIRTAHPDEALFGIVVEGARADLILVEENPLESLDALLRPLGTMVSGRWHDRDRLDALLRERQQGNAQQLLMISEGMIPDRDRFQLGE